jgi:hypothetical protein
MEGTAGPQRVREFYKGEEAHWVSGKQALRLRGEWGISVV